MKKIAIIVLSLIITVFFVFGVINYKKSYSKFEYDGYIIQNESGQKIYFSNNNNYRIVEDSQQVEFVNSDNEKENVNNEVFVHYLDGSLSLFKKAAVIDLSDMKKSSFQYYNIYAGSVFTKTGSNYKISYLEKQLQFSEFIIKISQNKYLVASPMLQIKTGDSVQNVKSGFIELTFTDGNIVYLQNQEIDIKNMPSNVQLLLDDKTYINLDNKKIYSDKKEKMNLGEITIDSDDYIEIVQDKNNTQIITDSEDKNETQNQTGNGGNGGGGTDIKKVNHKGDFAEVASGIVEAEDIEVETIIEDNAAIKDAEFTITSFEVKANSMLAEVSVKDEENVLTGTLYIKIIQSDSNEVVYYEQDNSGSFNIAVECSTLLPNTNYILVMNRNYEKNGVTYNKDFVQKTFVTESLGIEIEKEYVKINKAVFDIKKTNYSETKKVDYILYDRTSKAMVSNGTIDMSSSNKEILEFSGLSANRDYSLVLDNFLYGNTYINTSERSYTYDFKTLKNKPVIGNAAFKVDKKNSKFQVKLSNVNDINSGVKEYKVDIYDQVSKELITSKTTTTNEYIDFAIDGNLISRNTNYIAYAYLLFNDNEMEYEIPIGSQNIVMQGVEGPKVSFVSTSIQPDAIKGYIRIEDPNKTIDTTKKIRITYQDTSIGALTLFKETTIDPNDIGEDTLSVPIDLQGLRKEESYLFRVFADIDYSDGNGINENTEVSTFYVQTGDYNKMTLTYQDMTSGSDYQFLVYAQLIDYEAGKSASYAASTIQDVVIRFSSVDYDPTVSECTASNLCWEVEDIGTDPTNPYTYNSELGRKYYSNEFEISPAIFPDIDPAANDIPYGQYKIEILSVRDYTEYRNEIEVINTDPIVVSTNKGSTSIIGSQPIGYHFVLNGENIIPEDPDLNRNTQVGLQIFPNVVTSTSVSIKKITYYLMDAVGQGNNIVNTTTIYATDPKVVPIITYKFDSNQTSPLRRGTGYKVKYDLEYEIDGETITKNSVVSDILYSEKQAPQIDAYVSTRNETHITFKYKCYDVDEALVADSFYWFTNDENAFTDLEINTTGPNEYKTISIPVTGDTSLHIYTRYQILPNKPVLKNQFVNMSFNAMVTNFGGLTYRINSGINKSIIKLLNLSALELNKIAYADVTLIGQTKNVTLKNIIPEGGEIDIVWAEISELKGDGMISAQVKVYYDTEVYGVDTENSTAGFGIQKKSDDSYTRINGALSFTKVFNPETFQLTLRAVNNNTIEKTKQVETSKGYMRIDGEDINIKKFEEVSAVCTTGCSFTFDSVVPTFTPVNVAGLITTASVDARITGFEESDLSSAKISIYAYECANSDFTGCSNVAKVSKTNIAPSEFNDPIKIEGLDYNKAYLLEYKWKTASNPTERDFFYAPTSDYGAESKIKTTSEVGISQVNAYYSTDKVDGQKTRQIRIEHRLDIIEGYDGIKYQIFESAGSNPTAVEILDVKTEDMVLTPTGVYQYSIDIWGKLPTNSKYYVKITPYIGDNILQTIVRNFNFVINQISGRVVIIDDTLGDEINVQVRLTDTKNAVGNHTTYALYLNEINEENKIGMYQIDTTNSINLRCPATGSCTLKFAYEADYDNSNIYSTYYLEQEAQMVSGVSIGETYVGTPPNSNTIRIVFIDPYNIGSIVKARYTIYDYDGNEEVTKNDYATTFVQSSTASSAYTMWYLDISETLPLGYHLMQLQLYDEDDTMIANLTYDYNKLN